MSAFGPTGMGTRSGQGRPDFVAQHQQSMAQKRAQRPGAQQAAQAQDKSFLKDSLMGLNSVGEQMRGTFDQMTKSAIQDLSNTGRGRSMIMEGQPPSVGQMNPDQLRQYHNDIGIHQDELRRFESEVGYLQTAQDVLNGRGEAARQTVTNSLKKLLNAYDGEDMELGRNKSVLDRLQLMNADLSLAMRNEALIGGTAKDREAMRQKGIGGTRGIGPEIEMIREQGKRDGLSDVEVARRIQEAIRSKSTQTVESTSKFGDVVENLDEKLGGAAEGLGIGAGAGRGVATVLSFIPGVNVATWLLVGGGALAGGLIDAFSGEDEFDAEGRAGAPRTLSDSEKEQAYRNSEQLLFANVAMAMRDLGRREDDSKAGLEEDAYTAMTEIMRLGDGGAKPEEIMGRLIEIYERSGFDLGELHNAMGSVQDHLRDQNNQLAQAIESTRVMISSGVGPDGSPLSAKAKQVMRQTLGSIQQQQSVVTTMLDRSIAGKSALEGLGYENKGNPQNRLVTMEQQRKSAESILEGQLGALASGGDGMGSDELAKLVRDLPPELAQTVQDFMDGRGARTSELRTINERQNELTDLISEEEVLMRETGADLLSGFAAENVTDLNQQRQFESLLDELAN